MEKPVTFADRMLSSIASALLISITLVVVYFGIGYLGKVVAIGEMFENYENIYRSSLIIVALVAVLAFILGTQRTIVLFGHLWCTAQPRNIKITAVLWVVLLSIIVVPIFLFKN